MTTISVPLLDISIPLYTLLLVLGAIIAYLAAVGNAPRHRSNRKEMALYGVLAAGLGGLLGRLIYCLDMADWFFFDEVGAFKGLSPFFDLSVGGFCLIGVITGCLLAGPLTKIILKSPGAYRILDAAALPSLFFFAIARAIDPLIGQGYGDEVEIEILQFFPIMLEDGGYAICFLEALLALIIALALKLLSPRFRREGTLALMALTLLSASQILPESLRRDEFLTIFIFAQVNQIGYAVFLGVALILALLRNNNRQDVKRHAAIEVPLLLLGAGVCTAMEFALDKTNYPHALIYLVMFFALCAMAALTLRRIKMED